MPEISGLMRGKRGLVIGVANQRSLAWGIAKACRSHGAELAFTYQGDALKKRVEPLAEEVGGIVVGHCDVTEPATIDAVFAALQSAWGTIDFLVHAIAFSDKDELDGRYRRHDGGQFQQNHAGELLLADGNRAACREADAERRRHAHAHLLRSGKVDAPL